MSTKTEGGGMRIVGLIVNNFKRIELVELHPDGQPVEVTGENEQGKSSLLESIIAALGGGKAVPEVPVRRGASSASVVLDLGELVVERRWANAADRVGSLVVKTKEGARFSKGQEKLAGLLDALTFDPLAFMSMPPAEQRALLLRAMGVDVAAFDDRRRAVFEERTALSRDHKAVLARLAGALAPPEGTPEEEVSTDSLMAALDEAQETFRQNDAVRAAARDSEIALANARSWLSLKEEALLAARRALRVAEDAVAAAGSSLAEAEAAAGERRSAADALQDPPMDEIQGRFRSAEGINRNVRALWARRELEAQAAALASDVQARSAAIAAIDQEKAEKLESSSLPVEGLAVTDDCVMLDGLPLSQASQMRRIRVCTRIAAALNPTLRIALIKSGNDLTAKALEEFYAECAALGVQAWVERIVPSRSDAIEIVAGRVAGAEVPDV